MEKDYIKEGGYIEAIGRRKEAIARVRIFKDGDSTFTVNDKKIEEYFPTIDLIQVSKSPFSIAEEDFSVSVIVKGGGVSSQAEAIRHGLSRALVEFDDSSRKLIKQAGFLKRDPRKKERKKPGLKKARKAPQWSKR